MKMDRHEMNAAPAPADADLERECEAWDWVRAAGVSAEDLRIALLETFSLAEAA
jgi:hypothetical protein